MNKDIIVTGVTADDDLIWHNERDLDEDHSPEVAKSDTTSREPEYWLRMRNQWKATLIDFGFARALTPQDVRNPSLEIQRENQCASCHGYPVERIAGTANPKKPSFQRSSSSFLVEENSKCKTFLRSMSAVGNYEFAAPEIMDEMHKEAHEDPVNITDTIGHTVSEYGLLVDAYSLGCTLRYMMTGCLPHVCVKDAIARQKSVIRKLITAFMNKDRKRQIQYRFEEDLPQNAQRLIFKMTENTESKRTSVRTARQYPWIADVLPPSSDEDRKLEYLQLVLAQC